jgi:hypothetical protein
MYKILIYVFIVFSQQSPAESDDTRNHIYIYNYDVNFLKMSRVMLETYRGF